MTSICPFLSHYISKNNVDSSSNRWTDRSTHSSLLWWIFNTIKKHVDIWKYFFKKRLLSWIIYFNWIDIESTSTLSFSFIGSSTKPSNKCAFLVLFPNKVKLLNFIYITFFTWTNSQKDHKLRINKCNVCWSVSVSDMCASVKEINKRDKPLLCVLAYICVLIFSPAL